MRRHFGNCWVEYRDPIDFYKPTFNRNDYLMIN